MRRVRFGVCCLAVLVVTVAASPGSVRAQDEVEGTSEERSCADDPLYRALDFWVGEWQVVDTEGNRAGTNRIVKLHGGCLVEENWTSAGGGTGQSMNYFDPSIGKWRQDWVDARGGVVHYEGEGEDGRMRFVGRHIRRDGTVTRARVLLEELAGGRVHHLIEHSRDRGKSWFTYFDATYVPVGEPIDDLLTRAPSEKGTTVAGAAEPPAAPEAPAAPPPEETDSRRADAPVPPVEPTASDAEGTEGEVRAVSRRLSAEEIAREDRPQTSMASPMTLEVSLGRLQHYPEGAAWSTEETAAFVCSGVTLGEILVSKKERRKGVELELTFALWTRKFGPTAHIELELLSEGEVIASGSVEDIRLGRLVAAYDEKTGLRKSASLTLDEGVFEDIFRDTRTPTLRVTLTVE